MWLCYNAAIFITKKELILAFHSMVVIILQEFIAVSQLNASVQGKILCFTGPPGL